MNALVALLVLPARAIRYAIASRRVAAAQRKYDASGRALTCVGGPLSGERYVVHAQELRAPAHDEIARYLVRRDVYGREYLAWHGYVGDGVA